ncbi:HAD family phosphatase [Butyrivibrio sp. INlla16]|uniref:HAD family hydrolase n=1 Tax=Butyrivibrio sp. INlla16 TaxID=1520807 RepID=UPI00088770F0|nr:HAD-IA family hydrolase [Butyrivibrio sp. INlla16]SDB67308.1 beta-phosphoglucomutase [Butyrivibrio sp. INlla16]
MSESKKKNNLLIFDLDGTLFDTRKVNYYAYKEALLEAGSGIELDYDYYCKHCNGNDYRVFIPVIWEDISDKQLHIVHDKKIELYKKNLEMAKPNEVLFKIINSLKDTFYISIATTASTENTIDILEYFGKKDFFDLIITKENVKCTKPDPECFIKVMESLGVKPERTIIFEDSDFGIEAAKKSGALYNKVYGFN